MSAGSHAARWEGNRHWNVTLISQGTPRSKTGHSGFFFFLVPKANSTYTISFPAGQRKMGNRGLILTLVPLFVTKKGHSWHVYKDRRPRSQQGPQVTPSGKICSCAVHSPQTALFTLACPSSEPCLFSSQGPHKGRARYGVTGKRWGSTAGVRETPALPFRGS